MEHIANAIQWLSSGVNLLILLIVALAGVGCTLVVLACHLANLTEENDDADE